MAPGAQTDPGITRIQIQTCQLCVCVVSAFALSSFQTIIADSASSINTSAKILEPMNENFVELYDNYLSCQE